MDYEINISSLPSELNQWINVNILSQTFALELGICIILLCLSFFVAKYLQGHINKSTKSISKKWLSASVLAIHKLIFPLIGVTIIGLYAIIAKTIGWGDQLANIIASLFVAWMIINLMTSMLGTGYLVQWLRIIVLTVVILNIFGLLDAVILFLDNVAFALGNARISLYSVIKGISVFIILLWATLSTSSILENKIHHATGLTPSLKVLFSKLTKIFLFTITFLIALNIVRLDLTTLTVFSGAVGVGLGFGLQKIVSNFISGIILLSDKSIKPGDVIAVGDTYGWVNALGARYASVITRDGKEHLIPNELLITEKVENWSFSNNDVRIRIPIGVSYNTDVRKAASLILEAVSKTPRILQEPEPRCLFRGFGDSSINLELRVWINDPVNGMGNIQSDILFNIWDIFKENNIEIPFPQRDIHIRSVEEDKFIDNINKKNSKGYKL